MASSVLEIEGIIFFFLVKHHFSMQTVDKFSLKEP